MAVQTQDRGIERAFTFLRINEPAPKPRKQRVTQMRGPYYSPVGKRYLEDPFETMGTYVDALKFAGGSFSLMPQKALTEEISVCRKNDVLVFTGGLIEHVLTQGPEVVDSYINECKEVGFDIIEVSSGFITLPAEDPERRAKGQARSRDSIRSRRRDQSGGARSEGTRDPEWPILLAKRFLAAGAYMIMIESEGITENVRTRRTDVPAKIIDALGLEKVMFEAADPEVFAWYIRNYGPKVNLFVDHSQIVQLECLRSGIWGTLSTSGDGVG